MDMNNYDLFEVPLCAVYVWVGGWGSHCLLRLAAVGCGAPCSALLLSARASGLTGGDCRRCPCPLPCPRQMTHPSRPAHCPLPSLL